MGFFNRRLARGFASATVLRRQGQRSRAPCSPSRRSCPRRRRRTCRRWAWWPSCWPRRSRRTCRSRGSCPAEGGGRTREGVGAWEVGSGGGSGPSLPQARRPAAGGPSMGLILTDGFMDLFCCKLLGAGALGTQPGAAKASTHRTGRARDAGRGRGKGSRDQDRHHGDPERRISHSRRHQGA